MGYALATTVRRLVCKFTRNNKKVIFGQKSTVARFHKKERLIIITYDSGANNHYMSEADRIGLGLPILRPFHKFVAVAYGDTSSGNYVTRLPFQQFSTDTEEADTFEEFPSYLMSVIKTSEDGNVSIFADEKV